PSGRQALKPYLPSFDPRKCVALFENSGDVENDDEGGLGQLDDDLLAGVGDESGAGKKIRNEVPRGTGVEADEAAGEISENGARPEGSGVVGVGRDVGDLEEIGVVGDEGCSVRSFHTRRPRPAGFDNRLAGLAACPTKKLDGGVGGVFGADALHGDDGAEFGGDGAEGEAG